MKIYIAAHSLMMAKMAALLLIERGHTIVSSWVADGWGGPDDDRSEIAKKDLRDIDKCDLLLHLSTGSKSYRVPGGKHFETGYALGKGTCSIVHIGMLEHVFHEHWAVSCYDDLTEFLMVLDELSKDKE